MGLHGQKPVEMDPREELEDGPVDLGVGVQVHARDVAREGEDKDVHGVEACKLQSAVNFEKTRELDCIFPEQVQQAGLLKLILGVLRMG